MSYAWKGTTWFDSDEPACSMAELTAYREAEAAARKALWAARITDDGWIVMPAETELAMYTTEQRDTYRPLAKQNVVHTNRVRKMAAKAGIDAAIADATSGLDPEYAAQVAELITDFLRS